MRLLYILAATIMSGCASSNMIPFSIDSKPPGAHVDVNGVAMGVTPTSIQLSCTKRWVGIAVAPGGWAYDSAEYEIEVYPSEGNPGMTQTKTVKACQARNIRSPGITFDLRLDRFAPRQRVDVRIGSNGEKKSASRKLEETLETLSDLHNRGVLTDSEYQAKRDEAIANFRLD